MPVLYQTSQRSLQRRISTDLFGVAVTLLARCNGFNRGEMNVTTVMDLPVNVTRPVVAS